MSASVSEIKYWLEGSSWLNGDKNEFGDEGATYLSYSMFLGLSVLGGFFALDHLYLRSPWTFLAKFFVNIFCFGVWWFYDAMQAIFNTDVIKIYGLPVPGLGPKGIAAGVLAKEEPSNKHMRFFTYAAALFFGGAFGLDSFLVGDRQTGIIRLVSLLSMIGAPIALLWWARNLFRFFTDTKTVVNENGQYFGAAGGGSSLSGSLFGWLLSPLDWLRRIFGTAIDPLAAAIQSVADTGDRAIGVVDSTVKLGQTAIEKGSNIVQQVSEIAKVASQGAQVLPGVSLYSTVTPASVAQAIAPHAQQQQGGGGSLNQLPFAVLATLLIISLTGFVATYFRSRSNPQHVPRSQRTDTPPEPGSLPSASPLRYR